MQTKEGVTYSLVQAIGGSPLVPLFYKHVAELMEAGHCTFHTFERVTNRTQAIVAEIDNKIVGFLLFNYEKKEEVMFGFLGYVHPDYRRRSIFATIMDCWCMHANINDVKYVEGFISIKHEISLRAHRKIGFELFISEHSPEYYQYKHSAYL